MEINDILYTGFIKRHTYGIFYGLTLVGGVFKLIINNDDYLISISFDCGLVFNENLLNQRINNEYGELVRFGFFLYENEIKVTNISFNKGNLIFNLNKDRSIIFQLNEKDCPEVMQIEFLGHIANYKIAPYAHFNLNSDGSFFDHGTYINKS